MPMQAAHNCDQFQEVKEALLLGLPIANPACKQAIFLHSNVTGKQIFVH